MNYKTELHCHTSDVSRCAHSTGKEMAEYYISLGYTTVVLTNHLSVPTYTAPATEYLMERSWDEKIDFYMNGYNVMKEAAGDRLNIILGCELRSQITDGDLMIYGVTEEFLRACPDMWNIKIKDLSNIIRENGMIFAQPHPFRNDMKIVNPDYLDAVEVFNGNLGKNNRNRNDIARMWAEKFDKIQLSGSDTHDADYEKKDRAGIITEEPVRTNEDLLRILRSRNYELIRYGNLPW